MEGPDDLDAAVQLIERLRSEKEDIRRKFEDSRASHLVLQQTNAALRLQLADAQEAAELIKLKNDEGLLDLHAELDARVAEVNALRGKIISEEDIEHLRTTLAQEIEEPHRARIHHLESQVAEYQELNTKLRRDYELLREEHDFDAKHGDTFQKELDTLRQAEVEELKSRIEVLTLQVNNPASATEIRRLKRENTELQLRSMGLSAELDEVQTRRRSEQIEKDEAMRAESRAANDARMQAKSLSGEVDSLRIQNANLNEELSSLRTKNEDLRRQLHNCEKQNITMRGNLEDSAHNHRNEIRELQSKIIKLQTEWDRERQGLQEAVEMGHSQAQVLETALQNATNALVDKERDFATRIHETQEQEWARYRDLESEKMEIEGKLGESVRLLNETNGKLLEQETEFRKKEHACNSELAELTVEKNSLQEQIVAMEGSLKETKNQIKSLHRVEADSEKLKLRNSELNRNLDDAQTRNADLSSRMKMKENEITQIHNEKEEQTTRLRREGEELRRSLSTAQTKVREYEQTVTDLSEKMNAIVAEAKKKRESHHKQRATLRNTVAELEAALEQKNEENERLEGKNNACLQEIRSLQKKIEIFRSSVQSEGLRMAAGMAESRDPLLVHDDELIAVVAAQS
eukprot:m.68961 g.68961  ORF g.68961 m.68961 type:complete len:633 (+) comp12015_c0_seq2:109-2007(+)